jgi:methylthioribose-1-phosphate isomerase
MRTVSWGGDHIALIDQRALPWEKKQRLLFTARETAEAITDMTVRGAPAIGVTAAFGMALAALESDAADRPLLLADLEEAGAFLKAARPTAVNLMWAVDHMLAAARAMDDASADAMRAALIRRAEEMADDDVRINQHIGRHGAALIADGAVVLHHCNTGALAAVDYGTALGVIRTAHEAGRRFHVLLDETRPRLQGSRLSAWELEEYGISYDIVPDTAAGYYMARGEVSLCIVGADRIAANGDFANKIGTYQVAVLAQAHGIPFYTAAPRSTIDRTIAHGGLIPIEERDKAEVLAPYGLAIAPAHYRARNPAFDVTPHRLLSGIITECGILRAPFTDSIAAAMDDTSAL